MSRPISSSRGFVAAWLAAVAVAVASPSFASPSHVQVIEKVRPTAGRASEILVAGSLHEAKAVGLRSVEVEHVEEIGWDFVYVTLDVIAASGDHDFAFPVDLPPLAEGQPSLTLLTRLAGETSSVEVGGLYFYVHPPLAVDLLSAPVGSEGFYRLRVRSGGIRQGYFWGLPLQVVGNTIRVGVSWYCQIVCEPAPPEWELVSATTIGPLTPGIYNVELVNEDAYLPEARIAYRGQVEVPAVPDDRILLRQGRFEVEMELHPPHQEIPRLVMPPTEDSALFYFFSQDNWEAMVKVLDGCALNGKYWVFGAASTDVGYTLTVKDLSGNGAIREYRHEAGSPAPALTDIDAFDCD